MAEVGGKKAIDKVTWIGKPAVFLLCLVPAISLFWDFSHDLLSANPIADITNITGLWTLRFLTIALAVTPVRKIFALGWIGRFRRMIGLTAFFYGVLHFTTYIWLDKFFDISEMLDDVVKRRFIAVGFASFVMLIPLAMTSFNMAIRWLGGKRWNALHRMVYLTAIGGVVHFVWRVKADYTEPVFYGIAVGLLLMYRLGNSIWSRSAAVRAPAE